MTGFARRAGLACAVGAITVATACSVADPDDADLVTEDGLEVLVAGSSGEGGDALAVGKVVAAGGCVGIERDGFVHVAIWPKGTSVSDGQLTLPGGEWAPIGSTVSGGGEYLSSDLPEKAPRIPDGCAGTTDEVILLASVEPG